MEALNAALSRSQHDRNPFAAVEGYEENTVPRLNQFREHFRTGRNVFDNVDLRLIRSSRGYKVWDQNTPLSSTVQSIQNIALTYVFRNTLSSRIFNQIEEWAFTKHLKKELLSQTASATTGKVKAMLGVLHEWVLSPRLSFLLTQVRGWVCSCLQLIT